MSIPVVTTSVKFRIYPSTALSMIVALANAVEAHTDVDDIIPMSLEVESNGEVYLAIDNRLSASARLIH